MKTIFGTLYAVYNKDEDDLAIGHVHRQLRGYSPAVDGRDEAGMGICGKTKARA